MFEVNLFTPAQFGAFIPWLVIWRGPLSALVHPNTVPEMDSEGGGAALKSETELRDHTQRATWLGERVPLDLSMFYAWREKEIEERKGKKN
jgi:aromatic ring-cleaving dioxygenase